MKKIVLLAVIAALIMCLCGCQHIIEEFPLQSATVDLPPEPPIPSGETYTAGKLYGSYLTMYIGHAPVETRGIPYIKVFESYSEVEAYYNDTEKDHIYGSRFTIAMASFSDEFFAENDVLILALNEPNSYINHTAEPIEISPDSVTISITRHAPEAAPLLETEYQLIFTAPKGSFSGIDELPFELNISDVVDKDNNDTFDADFFRSYRPDYTPFCYRADILTDGGSGLIVDAIDGHDELVYFYDKYKLDFDLDAHFREDIGTLYNTYICDRYILIAIIVPCSSVTKPEITDIFVNNLEMFITVDAELAGSSEEPAACYLLLTGIERRDLTGVDLGIVNLSVE